VCVKPNSSSCDASAGYEICIDGHLHPRWHDWFDGFTVNLQPNGLTVLHGEHIDPSLLHGVLSKIGNLNLTIISVTRMD
jgi:hypothetical protein